MAGSQLSQLSTGVCGFWGLLVVMPYRERIELWSLYKSGEDGSCVCVSSESQSLKQCLCVLSSYFPLCILSQESSSCLLVSCCEPDSSGI